MASAGVGTLVKVILQSIDVLAGPMVSLVYPLYESIRVIETKNPEDDQRWLTYWILYSMITLFELTFARFVEWIPIWSYAKLTLTCWLVMPYFSGAAYVYEHFVRPYIGKESKDIEMDSQQGGDDDESKRCEISEGAVEDDEKTQSVSEPIVPQTPISTTMLKPCDKKPTRVSDDKENIDNRGMKIALTKGKGIAGEVPAEELSIKKLHKMLKALNPGEGENNGNNSGLKMALTKKKEDNGAGDGKNRKPAEELSITQLHKMLKALNPMTEMEERRLLFKG